MKGRHIVNYLRQTQSAHALQLALAEIANLQITKSESILDSIYVNGINTVYTFKDGNSYRVTYQHAALETGRLYPENTIIGEEYIRVHSAQDNSNEQWWRDLDWSDGLPLAGPFKNMTIPDNIVRFYWVSDWTDSSGATRKHIRADFDTTNTDMLDKFWYQIHEAEERNEKTLVDTDTLSTVDDGTDVSVNILDFYFRELYGQRGMVVDLGTEIFGNKIHESILHFVKRETPIGSVAILRNNGQQSADYS